MNNFFLPELINLMNPFSLRKTDFRKGHNASSHSVKDTKSRINKRSSNDLIHKSARIKDSYGAIGTKKKLSCSLLNVNGLTEASLTDVKDVLSRKQPDLCIIIETKLRKEEEGPCLDVPGYEVLEYR